MFVYVFVFLWAWFLGQGCSPVLIRQPVRSLPEVRWGVVDPPLPSGFESAMGGFAILFICIFLVCLVPLSLAFYRCGGPRSLVTLVLCLGVTGEASSTSSGRASKQPKSSTPAQHMDAAGHFYASWDHHASCPSCRYEEGHRCSIDAPCDVSAMWSAEDWSKLLHRRTYAERKEKKIARDKARSSVSGARSSTSKISRTAGKRAATISEGSSPSKRERESVANLAEDRAKPQRTGQKVRGSSEDRPNAEGPTNRPTDQPTNRPTGQPVNRPKGGKKAREASFNS